MTGISTPTEKRTDRIKAVISSVSTHRDGFLQRVNAFNMSVWRSMCFCVSMDQNVREGLLWQQADNYVQYFAVILILNH